MKKIDVEVGVVVLSIDSKYFANGCECVISLGACRAITPVENVRAFFFVAETVCERDGLVAVPLVEAPCTQVLLEGVQMDGLRKLAVCICQQSGTNALPSPARQNKELVNPTLQVLDRRGDDADKLAALFPDDNPTACQKMITYPGPDRMRRVG